MQTSKLPTPSRELARKIVRARAVSAAALLDEAQTLPPELAARNDSLAQRHLARALKVLIGAKERI
jgi:hypothetical protein